MIRSIAAVATLAVAGSAFAQVDFNLGVVGAGQLHLTGTTVGFANDIDNYAPIGSSTSIWNQDVIYSFTIAAPMEFSMTSLDANSSPDNDFWLLADLTTTLTPGGLRRATVIAQQTSLWEINAQAPFIIGPGTYYFVIDAWQGSTTATSRAGAYDVTINLVPTPAAAAMLGLGGLAIARRRRA